MRFRVWPAWLFDHEIFGRWWVVEASDAKAAAERGFESNHVHLDNARRVRVKVRPQAGTAEDTTTWDVEVAFVLKATARPVEEGR
jgi:hypothetical protein